LSKLLVVKMPKVNNKCIKLKNQPPPHPITIPIHKQLNEGAITLIRTKGTKMHDFFPLIICIMLKMVNLFIWIGYPYIMETYDIIWNEHSENRVFGNIN
jgi:hypothetical protein